MTENQNNQITPPDAQVSTGAVAPESNSHAEASSKEDTDKQYYNVKVPTLGTALKQLWKVGQKLAKKADPIADKAIDTLVGGIAKVSGLPDPKTGQQKPQPKPKPNNAPESTPTQPTSTTS